MYNRQKNLYVGRKFWFSSNGGCTIAGVVGREKKRAEEKASVKIR